MFIKLKHYETGLIQILNIDIDSYINFYVVDNELRLIKPTTDYVIDEDGEKEVDDEGNFILENEKSIIMFKSNAEAEHARDMIFLKLGTKSPANKVLDLTVFDEMTQDDDNKYVDINDIAQRFKTSPDKIRIVAVSDMDKKGLEIDDPEEDVLPE